MRGAGSDVFSVWGYVIAHVKADSLVEVNPEIVAFLIGMSNDRVEKAMEFLTAPDPKSRNKEHGGRRLVKRGEFEYYVPSAAYYRGIKSAEDLREYNRIKQRESRDRRKGESSNDVKEEKNGTYHTHSRAALAWLNEKSGHRYLETDSNLKLISARLSEEGVTIDGVKLMIERQVKKWIGTDMSDYLRPETLFGKTKFGGYYGAKEQPINQEGGGANHGTGINKGGVRNNPRLVGVCKNPNDNYVAAAKARSQVAGQVAQTGHGEPPGAS